MIKEFFCGITAEIKNIEDCVKEPGEKCTPKERLCDAIKSKQCNFDSGEFKEGCTEQPFK